MGHDENGTNNEYRSVPQPVACGHQPQRSRRMVRLEAGHGKVEVSRPQGDFFGQPQVRFLVVVEGKVPCISQFENQRHTE